MTLGEYENYAKVGQHVKLIDDSFTIMGEIGEIKENYFYVWQNEREGGMGKLLPRTRGYKYSWCMGFYEDGEIEITKEANVELKVGDKVKVIRIRENCPYSSKPIECCGKFIGKIGKIKRIKEDSIIVDNFPNTSEFCSEFLRNCLKKAKEANEMGAEERLRDACKMADTLDVCGSTKEIIKKMLAVVVGLPVPAPASLEPVFSEGLRISRNEVVDRLMELKGDSGEGEWDCTPIIRDGRCLINLLWHSDDILVHGKHHGKKLIG